MRASQVMCFSCGYPARLDETMPVTVRREGQKGKMARVCKRCAERIGPKGVESVLVYGKRYAVRLKKGSLV